MASPTYQALCYQVVPVADKSMISIWNASTKVVRVYRIFYWNTRYAAITGVAVMLQLNLITGRAGAGTGATVLKHDSDDPALDGSVYVETGATVTSGSTIQRFGISCEELTAAEATLDCFHNVMPFGTLWDCGYEDAEVQPLTFRQDEGMQIKCETTTQGYGDYMIEFTQADA